MWEGSIQTKCAIPQENAYIHLYKYIVLIKVINTNKLKYFGNMSILSLQGLLRYKRKIVITSSRSRFSAISRHIMFILCVRSVGALLTLKVGERGSDRFAKFHYIFNLNYNRSIASQRVDDRASIRTDGKHSVRGRIAGSSGSISGSVRQCEHQPTYGVHDFFDDNVERVNNTVQAQIERMFTDVIKDTSACSFPVRCLGSLPLKDKVTSLYGLQEPLRQLYLSGAGHGVRID